MQHCAGFISAGSLYMFRPDDGRLRPKHVEWPCRNKTCTVLHQVGVFIWLKLMFLSEWREFPSAPCMCSVYYRGADKSLAWPGRKQSNVSVRIAWIPLAPCMCSVYYRGADKSLARPGRKQTNVSVRMAWISLGALHVLSILQGCW